MNIRLAHTKCKLALSLASSCSCLLVLPENPKSGEVPCTKKPQINSEWKKFQRFHIKINSCCNIIVVVVVVFFGDDQRAACIKRPLSLSAFCVSRRMKTWAKTETTGISRRRRGPTEQLEPLAELQLSASFSHAFIY